MNKVKLVVVLPLFAAAISAAAYADETANNADTGTVQSDNSTVNQRDRHSDAVTADKQISGSANDLEATREIRRALTRDSHLSVYAQNIKIVALDGQITLRGPVKSQRERNKIGKIAGKIVGSNYAISNQLEVKE